MLKRILLYLSVFSLASVCIISGAGFLFLQQSQAQLNGKVLLKGLSANVTVTTDAHGIPAIQASQRLDAVRSLGYLTAQDRLFQMDLMRRKNSGRLAEIFGSLALDSDINARIYGFQRLAKQIAKNLPKEQQQHLAAYTQGVNDFLSSATVLPFEFTVLGYRPEPWQVEDSIIVALGMYEMLTAWTEEEERMLTVMNKTLPADVLAFLTPDTDYFTEQVNPSSPDRPAQKIPVTALENLLHTTITDAVQLRDVFVGSNAWAIAGSKTADGRAILANDMHLGLSVPTLWYRYEMTVNQQHSAGVMLPGVPLLIAGSNDKLAWGNTNLSGDFLDLVLLEINPNNANQYKFADGWKDFDSVQESIAVKDQAAHSVTIKQTVWGPVSSHTLLNQAVAIHWTALDVNAVNLDLLNLEDAQTLEQAIHILNTAGSPQLNVLLADNQGQIAWTLTGKIPKRLGFDGSVSQSWANGKTAWQGYLSAAELPKQINPSDAVLVSANDRRFDHTLSPVIGRQFANGYRAYRIKQRLNELHLVNEWSAFALQLDTESEFYHFYQQLALSLLTPERLKQHPELTEVRDYLLAWNGKADSDSLGLPLLVKFRQQLAHAVFNPFLMACKQADKNFQYSWTYIDTPLQALLNEKPATLLPDKQYADWNVFLLAQLQHSVTALKNKFPEQQLIALTWGKVNKAQLKHPFSEALPPFLGKLLNMPEDELSGCAGCVRVATADFGASERMVVSPAHLTDGILHTPVGQSAHPLSPYYRDQQAYWVQGLPLPLLSGSPQHHLVFHGR